MAKTPDLRNAIEERLPPERLSLVRLIAQQAGEYNLPLYLVGGFVRDLLLNQPAADFDLVVEGDATQLAQALVKRHGGKATVHPRFATAQWLLPESLGRPVSGLSTLDLTSTRSEIYKQPAALPTVRKGSLADDLQRRDFSINALAIRLDGKHFGELTDELGGVADLRRKLLRTLHPVSFIDDPTRLFRLLRYEQRYAFRIAPETLKQIPAALPGIQLLSAERVRHELDLVLEEGHAVGILARLAETGILAQVHPALGWSAVVRDRFRNAGFAAPLPGNPSSRRLLGWCLWLMGLPKNDLLAVDKRLHFDGHTRQVLLAASALFLDSEVYAGKKPSWCVAHLEKLPLAAVRSVSQALPPGPIRSNLVDFLETWRFVKPKTSGKDLLANGLPPGPAYQEILLSLRNAWLDGRLRTVRQEKMLLDQLMRKSILIEKQRPKAF